MWDPLEWLGTVMGMGDVGSGTHRSLPSQSSYRPIWLVVVSGTLGSR